MKTTSRHRARIGSLWFCVLLATAGGCGKGSTPAVSATGNEAQAAALAKSSEWYDKKVYSLAEMEARKAGDSVEAQYALLRSLTAQVEDQSKQDEAEKTAQSLFAKAPAGSEPAKSAQEVLTQRQIAKKLAKLREALAQPGADKTKLLAEVPREEQGPQFHGLAFESLNTGAEAATKESPAYQHATQYLASQPEGPLAEKASKFVADVDKLQGQARSPLQAFKNALAEDTPEARALRSVKVLSSTEKSRGELGAVDAQVQFTNPYTKKSDKATILVACNQRRDGWQVNWKKSDLSMLGPLKGQPEHNFSDQGIKGVASAKSNIEEWSVSLELVPADVLYNAGNRLKASLKEQGQNLDDIEGEVNIFRAKDKGILVIRSGGNGDHLAVIDPRYRLASGLGVGDKVEDFLTSYNFRDPGRPQPPSGSGVISGGVVDSAGNDVSVFAIPMVPKGSKGPQLTLYLERTASLYPSTEEIRTMPVWGMAYVPRR